MINTRSNKHTAFFLAMLGFLSYINFVIPENNKIIALISSYAFVIGTAKLVGLDYKALGLSRPSVKNGFKTALPFMIVTVFGALLVYLISPDIFKDSRYQLTSWEVLYLVLIILPTYTVIFEELAFRGVLFGTLLRVTTQKYSIVISALAFGFWHIFTARSVKFEGFSEIIILFAVVLATSFAGAFFTWLRIKSDSLLAPILVHWTINATGIILAYFAWL
jgi:uncharacterized protein